MGMCKGNDGHLMQHWTFCEVLQIAGERYSGLNYIDAYAMAPESTLPPICTPKFNYVRTNLPGQGSLYEQAWLSLALSKPGVVFYPSSAAFVPEVWKGNYSLLLCEKDQATAAEIAKWLPNVGKSPKCKRTELFPGDWRHRFDQGLPSPSAVGLPDDSITIVTFDPNICSINSPDNPGLANLYIGDLPRVLKALNGVKGGVIIQMSTYSTMGGNPQPKVRGSFSKDLRPGGFTRAAVVRLDGNMMSMVYTRNANWAKGALAKLPVRFEKWMRNIP